MKDERCACSLAFYHAPFEIMQDDMSFLTELLARTEVQHPSHPPKDTVIDENADNNLAELLQQLESADSIARGVESRLDGLLDELDGLLEQLEGPDGAEDGNGLKADLVSDSK